MATCAKVGCKTEGAAKPYYVVPRADGTTFTAEAWPRGVCTEHREGLATELARVLVGLLQKNGAIDAQGGDWSKAEIAWEEVQ